MMIEDEELRGIYQTASEERLQALDAGLLALEQRPDDRTILDGLMREAHSLKGDSNMLGLSHIGQGAHHLETILGRVKRGEQAFSADLGDRLARGLEVMRQMVQAAVTGRPWAGTAAAAIAAMEGTVVPCPASAPLSGGADLEEMPVLERASAPGTPPPAPWSVAAQPQIERLATGLQQLIEQGGDRALLPDLIAVAQALATTASAGNQQDFTTLTRQVAWLLTALHQGEEGWTAALGDRLTHGVTALTALAAQATTGDRPTVNTFYALAELMGAPAPEAAVSGDPVPEPAAVSPTAAMNGTAAARLQTTAKAASYRIETIRVPTHSLDALMNQTGELTVTKIRVAHRLGEIDAIANLWEDWSRDLFKHRFLCHEVQQGQKSVRQLESLHNRTEQ
ncbi:MAG TPA: Hpt domain-containing protein [Candidatus Obscuribacterales bacterium]